MHYLIGRQLINLIASPLNIDLSFNIISNIATNQSLYAMLTRVLSSTLSFKGLFV